jgi:hypothetical protein
MTPFWIEVRDAKGVLKSRQQFTFAPVVVGRGAQSQVLLDDPYCAASHAHVLTTPDGLVVEALPSKNGLRSNGKAIERLAIGPATTVQMGKSQMTIRTASEPVEAERSLSDSRDISANSLGWPAIVAMTALMFGIEFFGVWSGMVREGKVTDFLAPVLTLGGFALGWSFFWSFLNRVFGGVFNFRQHLFVAMAAILVSSCLNELLDLAGYGFALRHVGSIDSIMRYLAAAVACYFHLKIISSENMRFKSLALGSLLMGFLAVLGVSRFEQWQRSAGTQVYAGSKAPAFVLKGGEPLDKIFQNFDKTQATIDRQRKEKPGEGGDFDGLFDD